MRTRAALYWRLFRALAENPAYFRFILGHGPYQKTAAQLQQGQPLRAGSFFPVKLDLRVVYACNLRCKMCGQWGDTGSYFDYSTVKLQKKLEVSVIERVVRELAPRGLRFVDMEGGETFLHPQIIDLLRMLKSYKLLVKPVTNGTLLERYAKDIVDARLDAVHVSVDGDKQFHNHVRQASWAFDRTMEGLAAVRKARRDARRHTPLLVVNFTMTRHNGPASLRRLCSELNGRGLADVLTVKASPIWMPKGKGEAYDTLVAKHFGAQGITSWHGFVEDYSGFDAEAEDIVATLRDLKQQEFDFFFDVLPSIPLENLPRMYREYDWDLGRSHCPIPYLEPTIDADGHVYPCNLFTDESMSMGNINESSFLDIWMGERYERFRNMLRGEGGLLPICNRCCQLTES